MNDRRQHPDRREEERVPLPGRRADDSAHLNGCPLCHDPESRIVESRERPTDLVIVRRKECRSCKHRYTTYEGYPDPASQSDALVP